MVLHRVRRYNRGSERPLSRSQQRLAVLESAQVADDPLAIVVQVGDTELTRLIGRGRPSRVDRRRAPRWLSSL
jgi:hypothetical protein